MTLDILATNRIEFPGMSLEKACKELHSIDTDLSNQLGEHSSVLSITVINIKQYDEQMVYFILQLSVHCEEVGIENSVRNLEVETEVEATEECCLLVCSA